MMNAEKRKKLEGLGYTIVDDTADWLGLSNAERKIVEARRQIGAEIRRLETRLPQVDKFE